MASGYAGAAVMNHLGGVSIRKDRFEFGPQHFRRLENSACGEVIVVEAVQRARNAPSHGIDRFLFAAVARGRAGIQEKSFLQIFLNE